MTTPDNCEKPSFSGSGDGHTCVELGATPGTIHLRESDTPATHLTTTPTPLSHLLRSIKTGTLTA